MTGFYRSVSGFKPLNSGVIALFILNLLFFCVLYSSVPSYVCLFI